MLKVLPLLIFVIRQTTFYRRFRTSEVCCGNIQTNSCELNIITIRNTLTLCDPTSSQLRYSISFDFNYNLT